MEDSIHRRKSIESWIGIYQCSFDLLDGIGVFEDCSKIQYCIEFPDAPKSGHFVFTFFQRKLVKTPRMMIFLGSTGGFLPACDNMIAVGLKIKKNSFVNNAYEACLPWDLHG